MTTAFFWAIYSARSDNNPEQRISHTYITFIYNTVLFLNICLDTTHCLNIQVKIFC